MEVNKLRINNKVKCSISNDAGIYNVVAINGIDQVIYLDGARYKEKIPIDKIKPILLTEEWLLKFGFVKHTTEKSDLYKLNNFTALYTHQGRFKGKKLMRFANIDFVDFWNCKYVHELQNLYFALTGQELELI